MTAKKERFVEIRHDGLTQNFLNSAILYSLFPPHLMKKATIICFVLAIMVAARAQVPEFKWVQEFGSIEFVYAINIVADDNGNLYTLGFFSGKHDFDPGAGVFELESKGNFDAYVMKTDAGGNFVWAKSIGGPGGEVAFSIDVDVNGNVYISGSFEQNADFDSGPGTYTLTAKTVRDMFICKLDPSGNLMWAVAIPGLAVDGANFLATDDFGNVYMSGNFTGSVDFDPGPGSFVQATAGIAFTDIFILKLDADGNFIWAKHLPTNNSSFVFAVAVDGSGNVYTSGDFAGTVDFDPAPGEYLLTSEGENDGFILKIDADGNFQWAVSFGGTKMDDATAITIDDFGNVYTTGGFTGTVDFDPGPGIQMLNSADATPVSYIMKLDPSGHFIWAKKIGNALSRVMDIFVNDAGDVYATGFFRETFDFDPGSSSDDLTANETDMFVAKFSTDGVFEWSQQVTGPGLDYGLGLTVDKYGNIFTTGIFHGTADFDPGAGLYEVTSEGEGDVYILKTGICAKKPASSITETRCNDFTLNDRTYTASGIFKQTIINAEGCDSTITLNLTITGQINTNVVKSICQGESYAGYITSGSYADSYVSVNGCDSIRTLTLTVVNKPSPFLGDDILLCKGDSISLHPGQFESYTWQDGSNAERMIVSEAGVYKVTVQNSCGSSSDEIIVKSGPCGIYFPTAFTPNNDGVNDKFRTAAGRNFFSSYHLVIYNRWGQKVFETNDPLLGWDGRVNGIMQTEATFVWACTYVQSANGLKDSKRGTVTLLK